MATTTKDGEHPTVEGVEDTGGHVYFKIPPDKALGPGRHRVHMVVKGDLSTTEQFIEVVPKGTPVFVSDVDGTLTTTETEEFSALLTGTLPDVQPGAVDLFKVLVQKGYHPFYLTARPEWLMPRTREFLSKYDFPPGVTHTTLTFTGALGNAAATYKTDELALLAGKGIVPTFGFGNTATDADAYFNAGIEPAANRIFLQFDDAAHGGRRIESYTDLMQEVEALPSLCP
jgi:phosphatidate phosphatase PAH1